MNQLRTAIDVRKVELVTEEIARINREAAVKAEVAREIDDFVRALNEQHPSGRLDTGNLSAISGLTGFDRGKRQEGPCSTASPSLVKWRHGRWLESNRNLSG
jgi:hypothetical protein